jgi:hypothetical protein
LVINYAKNNLKFKEKEVTRAKNYRDNNLEKSKLRENNYKRINRSKVGSYAKEKYAKDPNSKLAQIIRVRIRRCIKIKSNSSSELLGSDIIQVKNHIESLWTEGMTWDNHGITGWHIDHIIPISSFDLTNTEEQKKCFHYTNMQPLWAEENLSKGCR